MRIMDWSSDVCSSDLYEHRALLIDLFDEALTAMDEAERHAGGFVADRVALDFADFWLYFGFGFDAAATARFMGRVPAAVGACDRILMLPRGALPLVAAAIRTPNPRVPLHVPAPTAGQETPRLPPGP